MRGRRRRTRREGEGERERKARVYSSEGEWRDAGRREETEIVIAGPCCLLICVSVSSR